MITRDTEAPVPSSASTGDAVAHRELTAPVRDIADGQNHFDGEDSEDVGGNIDGDDQAAPVALATSFDELISDESLVQVLTRLKISAPTEIQSRALPVLIDGKDAILQAQTGSGKTLAFVLPLITQLRRMEQSSGASGNWSSLLITPTRELALQIESVIRSIADDYSPVCLIGGADMQAQIRALKQDARIVVGTPGRILDLMRQKELKLRQCRFFVVDEVDELLSTGFLEDIRHILTRLPDKRQGVFVSATVTPRVEMLAHSFLSKPARIIASSEEPSVQHCYCEVGADLLAKTTALCDLVETYRPRSAIVFCNTKSDTQLVEALLRRRGFDARRINSDLTQKQRNRIMKLIRDQELQLLIATDVAARGIDIAQLDLVVNYAIHDQPETYVHRTGRTGRAGRSGRAISLIGPRDFGAFHHLTKVLSLKFEKLAIPGDTEVADARLTHLYELLRLQEIEVKDRDLLVARQLLREQGGIEAPSENLEAIVAKLCRSAIEHSLGVEAKGLDEEEVPAEESEQRPKRDQSREGREGEDRRGRRDRGDRGDRREGRDDRQSDAGRGDSGRGDSRRDNRRERGRDNQRRERDSSPQVGALADERTEPRSEHRRAPEEGEERRDYRAQQRPQADRQVRVYIGQGTKHGMTSEIFCTIAADFADVAREKILSARFREIYGFVDIAGDSVQPLVESLNGIEYNGHLLPVEIALVKEPRERHYQRGSRRGDGGSRSGDSRSRHDNRGSRHSGRGSRDRYER